MMCHRIGRPPISIMGFGLRWDSSLIRVPKPPARMTAFMTSILVGEDLATTQNPGLRASQLPYEAHFATPPAPACHGVGFNCLARSAATEAALAPLAGLEVVDDFEIGLHDRHDDELGDPVEWVQRGRVAAAIPAADHQRP